MILRARPGWGLLTRLFLLLCAALLAPLPAMAAPCHTLLSAQAEPSSAPDISPAQAIPLGEGGGPAQAAQPMPAPSRDGGSLALKTPASPEDRARRAARLPGLAEAAPTDAFPLSDPPGQHPVSCCLAICLFCTVPQDDVPLPGLSRKVLVELVPWREAAGAGLNPVPALGPPRRPA